jgi:hypothetical protein
MNAPANTIVAIAMKGANLGRRRAKKSAEAANISAATSHQVVGRHTLDPRRIPVEKASAA